MSLEAAYNALTYVSIFSIFVPILTLLINFQKINLVLNILFIFLLISGLFDFVCLVHWNDNNLLNGLLNVFSVVEGFLVIYIYKLELRKRSIAFIALASFSIVCFWRFVILNQVFYEDTIVSTLEAFIIIILGGIYFHKLLSDDNIARPAKFYFFWINLAFLFNFGASLLLFATNDFINRAPKNIASILWGLHLLVNIGCNFLFARGTWKIQKY